MAATEMKNRGTNSVEVIRAQHWLELGDYLGQRPAIIKATMKLWFTVLAELGYELVATGANHQAPRPAATPPPPAAPQVSHTEVYHAVEEGLLDVASRRSQGERISDQAEVRAIVAKVLDCIGYSDDNE